MKQLFLARLKIRLEWLRVYVVGVIKLLLRRIDKNLFFTAIERYKINNRLRFWKTIYLNCRVSPWKYAKHTPVWVYGYIKYFDLSGSILPLPETEIQPGTFRLGHMDPTRSYGKPTVVMVSGTIYYGNNVEVRQGAKLRISGELILDNNVFIADNSSFYVDNKCTINKCTLVANNVSFMDNDVHYMVSVPMGIVKPNVKPIVIGAYNWIGTETMIKKGTVTCDYLIIAGPGSCLMKDYSDQFKQYDLVAGIPLRLIKSGVRIVFNFDHEAFLKCYFSNNNDSAFSIEGSINDFCTPKNTYERFQ